MVGKPIGFREYLLSEAIKPVKTGYGLNDELNNLEIFENQYYITFSKITDTVYSIYLGKDGELSFGYFEEFNSNKPVEILVNNFLSTEYY